MFDVPVLEPERTRLRGHGPDDFPNVLKLWQTEEVYRFIHGKPATEEEAWTRFLRYIGHWHVMGYGYWVVEDRETGAFLGETGFADYHRGIDPSMIGTPETGWVLGPIAQGRGIATEVVKGMLDWAAGALSEKDVVCIIDSRNKGSHRVADKTGFTFFKSGIYHGKELAIYTQSLG